LKLQIDCYQEQLQVFLALCLCFAFLQQRSKYFAVENQRLQTRSEAALASKDVMLDGFADALKVAREDRERLRKVDFGFVWCFVL
jgi:hypothetical protein